ncbi:ClpP/crotonase-like domain-containing protein [Immersiella caudata]|uniref:ClpP/crotonase-like domain-containing protein n=1 Tax=Immersiella caudata TaxID=314043 RepID=A0AA39X537_9PEZI|nr:ClpP/crotonase-like domain-containing protein [Immersiella caudata]
MSSNLPAALKTPPPSVPNVLISFPAPHVLLITLNRPKQLNAIPSAQHAPLASLYDWYDFEPHLRAAILTGSGRAFCAGADLREWDRANNSSPSPNRGEPEKVTMPPSGFGGLSNRPGLKPIIAAVNGLCYGGGFEMVLNCDIVVAAETAKFGLPEVSKGVVALAGALPRLSNILGRQRASELALLGRTGYTATEMREWGVVNFVVPNGQDIVREAVKLAEEVAGNSPDAVIVSREGLRLGRDGMGEERATEVLVKGWYGRIDKGENMREGVRSFVEKRGAVWVDSKL